MKIHKLKASKYWAPDYQGLWNIMYLLWELYLSHSRQREYTAIKRSFGKKIWNFPKTTIWEFDNIFIQREVWVKKKKTTPCSWNVTLFTFVKSLRLLLADIIKSWLEGKFWSQANLGSVSLPPLLGVWAPVLSPSCKMRVTLSPRIIVRIKGDNRYKSWAVFPAHSKQFNNSVCFVAIINTIPLSPSPNYEGNFIIKKEKLTFVS